MIWKIKKEVKKKQWKRIKKLKMIINKEQKNCYYG